MPLDSRTGFAGGPMEGVMQAAPNLSPAQLFENARRAVQDGQLAIAEQFLRHVLAIAPHSPEGMAAQQELGRLMRHRAAVEQAGPGSGHSASMGIGPPGAGSPAGPGASAGGPPPGPSAPGYGAAGYGAPGGNAGMMTNSHYAQPPHAQPPPAPAPGWDEPSLTPPQGPGRGFSGPMPGSGNGFDHQPTRDPVLGRGPVHGAAELEVPHGEGQERMPAVVTNGRKPKRRGSAEAAQPSHRAAPSAAVSELEPPSGYGFGRFLAGLVGILGWLSVLGGLGTLAASLATLIKVKLPVLPLLAIGVLPAAQIFVGGLALILIRSIARAAFDAAHHSYVAAAYAQMAAQGDGAAQPH